MERRGPLRASIDICILVLFLNTIFVGVSAHHDETFFKDIFADTPYRVESAQKYIPVLVEIKDADSCDYDLKEIKIWWDMGKNSSKCCDNKIGGDVDCDLDDCSAHDEDLLIGYKNYRKDGNNLVIEDRKYNMYSDGDWYDIIYVPKSGYDLLKGQYYVLSGETLLLVEFIEDDWWDDCADGDSYSIVLVWIDDFNLPVIKGERYYGGDTHYHSSYTDLSYFFHGICDEFGNPIEATVEAGRSIGLHWTAVTDHSQELSEDMFNSLGYDCYKFSKNDFRILRGEEVSCEEAPGFAGYNFRHILAYNISSVIHGYEMPIGYDVLRCDKVIDIINNQGGFCYVAHPYSDDTLREPWPWPDHYQYLLQPGYRGFELWNADDYPNYNWLEKKWRDDTLLKGKHVFVSAGSDAHGEFSSAYMSQRYDTLYNVPYGGISTWCHMCDLTDDNVWSALEKGQCYMRSTDGPALHFDINGVKMGGKLKWPVNQSAKLTVKWNSTFTAFKINIYKGEWNYGIESESIIKTLSPSNYSGETSLPIDLSKDCTHYSCYYRVEAISTPAGYFPAGYFGLAYSNPIWIIPDSRDCVEPYPGLEIWNDTKLCSGVYVVEPCAAEGLKGAAITIKQDNVTLDCNGATIMFPSEVESFKPTIGIFNPGYDDVTIENCNLKNYSYGIEMDDSEDGSFTGNRIFNNTIASSRRIGIHLKNSSVSDGENPNWIVSNTVTNSKDSGIFLESTSRNKIVTNLLKQNGFGVDIVANSPFNLMEGNIITGNLQHGIFIHGCNDCRSMNEIVNNTIDFNSEMGILIMENWANRASNNTIKSNRFGIYLSSSDLNTLDSNEIKSSKQHGIRIDGSSLNTITSNTIQDNAFGIAVKGSGNYLSRNDLRYNKQLSLWFDGAMNQCNNYIDQMNYADLNCSGALCTQLPILYEHDTSGLSISGEYAEVLLCNVSDSNLESVKVPSNDKLKNDGIFLFYSDNNTISDSESTRNRFGIYLYQSSNNSLFNNVFDKNANYGVLISDLSSYNEISSCRACFNGKLDFQVSAIEATPFNWGYKNTCDENDGWKDRWCNLWDFFTGQCFNWTLSDNCTYSCGFNAIQVIDTAYINNNTKLACNQTYYANDADGISGVIRINSNDVILDCCNSTLIGNESGIGIYNPDFEDVTIRNCNIINYKEGIKLESSNNNTLFNNIAKENECGINILNSNYIEIYQNLVCGNAAYDFKIINSDGFGANNICDKPDGWSDLGKKYNCTFQCTSPPPPKPKECYCSFCSECEDKLNDPNCDIVYLTKDIFLHHGTCINNPAGFRNKIFDCQKHVIEGDGLDEDYGIYLSGDVTGNVIRNCVITNFYSGIYIKAFNSSVSDNQVINNFINSNIDNGIVLNAFYEQHYSIPAVERNAIDNNIISLNGNNGIKFFFNGGLGTFNDNTISSNKIISNGNGIKLHRFNQTKVIENKIYSNNDTGIEIIEAALNQLTRNNIIRNRIGIKMGELYDTLINENKVCRNEILDFEIIGPISGWGELNYCDKPDGWNDQGAAGCVLSCPAIVECICSNCTDCSDKLQDPMCDLVYLESDIINQSGTCINSLNNPDCYNYFGEGKNYRFCIFNPKGFNNKVFDCQGHVIDGNKSENGITMHASRKNEISNCIITDFDRGIYLTNSQQNILFNNFVNSNNIGIFLHSSFNNSIFENNLTGNRKQSLFLQEECNNFIENNTGGYNGKKILYIHDASGIAIENNEFAEIIFCNVSNSMINNVKVYNNDLKSDGIFLIQSNNNWIMNSNSSNNYRGINLWNSSGNMIVNNIVNSNIHGVYIELFSNRTCVINNTINSNEGDGIDIWGSHENIIINNTLKSNKHGIYLEVSNNNSLSENIIDSGNFGVNIASSSSNVLFKNIMKSNNNSGIFISSNSHYNKIENNKIINNGDGIITLAYVYDDRKYDLKYANSNNSILGNKILKSNRTGITSFLSHSIIESNLVCENGASDFFSIDWLNSTGFDNTCINSDGWNDYATVNCTYLCPGPDVTPPSAVTNLQVSASGEDYILWTWINPSDEDFEHVMVYLNGIWKQNISGTSYNATNLAYGTNYTIGTHTVDIYGNINATMVTNTSMTEPKQNTQTAASINANTSHEFLFNLPSLASINVTANNTVGNIQITVQEYNNTQPPGAIAIGGDDKVYRYLNISTNIASGDLKRVVITFNITRAWLTANGVDETKVKLNRYNATIGSYESYLAAKIADDGVTLTYTATLPRLSIFAITGGLLPPSKPPSEGGGGGGGGGGAAPGEPYENIADTEVRYILAIAPNKQNTVEFKKSSHHILEISFAYSQVADEVSVTLEKLINSSLLANLTPPGVVFENINIWVNVPNPNYISNASIKFYVEKSWILANSIDPNSIALYRFKDGTWNKLNTSKISENETLLFYFASTPSFSPFAISGEKIGAITPALIPTSTPTPTPTPIAGPAEISPTPTKPAPGFDLMVVIIGVTIATYLWKRKF